MDVPTSLAAGSRSGHSALAPRAYADVFYQSHDGIRLHYRDYAGPSGADRTPVICIPGLTRNARDFEDVAACLAQHRRVIAVDLRGRGESGHAPDPMSYVPLTYAQDIAALLDAAGITRFVALGTSLGGIVTMIIAGTMPGKLAGAVLNDVGPAIDPAGLARIRGYVGQGGAHRTWIHAARHQAELAGPERFPGYRVEDWLRMVKRSHRLTREGRIVADYDAKISQPFGVPGGEAGVDLWPALAELADLPVLIVRGGNSDILSADGAEEMAARLDDARVVTVPDVGHAPTLEEPEVALAIDALLGSVDAAAGSAA